MIRSRGPEADARVCAPALAEDPATSSEIVSAIDLLIFMDRSLCYFRTASFRALGNRFVSLLENERSPYPT